MRDDVRSTLHGPRRLPFGHVPRSRLHPAFRYRGAKVTLLCAPAGFGKSTLVREWLDLTDAPCVYYAPPTDGATADRLWVALANGLRRIDRERGAVARDLMKSASPDLRQVAEEIAVDLSLLGRDVVVVIEDLHKYDDPSVHRDIGRLAEQIPDNAHLVLTSRSQPDLPMALLRSRELLAEIYADDLRITATEIADYLHHVGLESSPEIVDHLQRATDGWAAGLGLLVAAAQRRNDPIAFLTDGPVLTSQIGELLRSEVLAGLSPETQEFLTVTSFLPTLSPGLCDRVTGSKDSARVLQQLSVNQAFVHRIEAPGEWYALHQLLGDLLRSDLDQRDARELVELRNRSSEWFEQSGRPAEALEQSMLAGDADRVRRLVAEHSYYLHDHGHQVLARRALADAEAALPTDPAELLGIAEALGFAAFGGATLRVLAAVERSEITDPAIRGRLAVLRCIVSSYAGDLVAATSAYETAVDLLGDLPQDELGRRTRVNLARCRRLAGDLDGAEQQLLTLVALDGDDLNAAALFARGVHAAVCLDRGELERASELAQSAVRAWDDHGRPATAGATDMYLVLGSLAEEAGDVDGARDRYGIALEMTTHTRQGLLRAVVLAALGRFEARCGNHDLARSLVGEIPTWWPEFPPGPSLRAAYDIATAELLLAAGQPDAAQHHLPSPGGDPYSSTATFVGTLRARIRLALGAADRTDLAPPAALDSAPLPVRIGRLLADAEVLLSLGDRDGAIRAGRAAVALGLGAGFRATFTRSPAVLELGHTLVHRGEQPAFDELLSSNHPLAPDESAAAPVLLSEKEAEVLALLPTHLSYAGIAAELFVSVNTVKFHVKNVYAKLGVNDRAGAVRRGRDLGLLTGS